MSDPNRQTGRANRTDVMSFIDRHIREEGWPPSIEEIAKALEMSKSTVHKHIVELEDEGKLFRNGPRRLLTVIEGGKK